jgi:hypothetical protein
MIKKFLLLLLINLFRFRQKMSINWPPSDARRLRPACEIPTGGVDFRKLEPFTTSIEPKINELRKLYRKNPRWFQVPKFAVKVY